MGLWLVDTNLLLRSVQPELPEYNSVSAAFNALAEAGEAVCVVPQVIAEF